MAIGLVGRKCGMTRVFTEAGETVPVTVIEVLPNRVTQVKSADKDGYRAVQVTYGKRRPQLLSKAVAGHYAKAKVAPGQALVEFRLGREGRRQTCKAGAEFKADLFKAGQMVDVTGTTIGKGFAGTMKRHNFARPAMPRTVVSVSHRAPGSIGQRQTPGRVFQGKRMSGHMGVDAPHHREPARRRGRCRAQPAADPRRRAGRRGRPGHRASLGEGGAPGEAQDHRAEQGRPTPAKAEPGKAGKK